LTPRRRVVHSYYPTPSSTQSCTRVRPTPHHHHLTFFSPTPYRIHIIRRIASHPVTIFWISSRLPILSCVSSPHTQHVNASMFFHPISVPFCFVSYISSVYPALHILFHSFNDYDGDDESSLHVLLLLFFTTSFSFLLFLLCYIILLFSSFYAYARFIFYSWDFRRCFFFSVWRLACAITFLLTTTKQPTTTNNNNNKCIKYRPSWFCRLECFISFPFPPCSSSPSTCGDEELRRRRRRWACFGCFHSLSHHPQHLRGSPPEPLPSSPLPFLTPLFQ